MYFEDMQVVRENICSVSSQLQEAMVGHLVSQKSDCLHITGIDNENYLQPVHQCGSFSSNKLCVINSIGVQLMGEEHPVHHDDVGEWFSLLKSRNQLIQPVLKKPTHLRKNMGV